LARIDHDEACSLTLHGGTCAQDDAFGRTRTVVSKDLDPYASGYQLLHTPDVIGMRVTDPHQR
jgi:hypothetical protein